MKKARNWQTRTSRFICLRCLKLNQQGMYRRRIREKGHIKNLYCSCTKFTKKTKNLEVRYCDNLDEMIELAVSLHEKYYKPKEEEKQECQKVM